MNNIHEFMKRLRFKEKAADDTYTCMFKKRDKQGRENDCAGHHSTLNNAENHIRDNHTNIAGN